MILLVVIIISSLEKGARKKEETVGGRVSLSSEPTWQRVVGSEEI